MNQHLPNETLPCDSLKPVKGLSRRNVLGALAVLSVAPPAAAEAAADPIFAAIEKHRDLSASCDAAVAISASMATDGPDFEAADAVTGQRQQLLIDHANTLIRSEPTTLAGAVALMRHVASIEGPVWVIFDRVDDRCLPFDVRSAPKATGCRPGACRPVATAPIGSENLPSRKAHGPISRQRAIATIRGELA